MPNSPKEKLRDFILDLVDSKCKDTTGLISESMDHQISIFKRWSITVHLTLCKYCREYKAQMQTIRNMTQGLEQETPDMESKGSLKSNSKERMKALLKQND